MEGIKEYFRDIEKIVLKSPIIATHEIKYEAKSRKIGIIQGKIIFVNSYIMEFLELAKLNKKILLLKYRFHLMDKDKNMIFRYDNSPHHHKITSFPHHKHIIKNNRKKIIPYEEMNIFKVLEEIQRLL